MTDREKAAEIMARALQPKMIGMGDIPRLIAQELTSDALSALDAEDFTLVRKPEGDLREQIAEIIRDGAAHYGTDRGAETTADDVFAFFATREADMAAKVERLEHEALESGLRLEMLQHEFVCEKARADTAETRVTALEAERDRLAKLVDLLRADLQVSLGCVDPTICEGCGAPIYPEEDASTADDVHGCWAYVAEDLKSPCYRYRTQRGADRSWPECAALTATTEAEHGK